MKKTFRFLASLTLGFMVASCQNGLEEVINESEVQDELATTRADLDTPIDEEIIEEYATGPDIDGDEIFGNTASSKTYSVIPPPGTTTTWSYSTSLFNCTFSDDSNLILTLANAYIGADAIITAYYYNANGTLNSTRRKFVGINGPYKNLCTVRVIRNSDLVEVYPSSAVRLEPNTAYTAYFMGTSSAVTPTEWIFSNVATQIPSSSGDSCYFITDSQGWSFLEVKGIMSPYNVEKTLVDVTLFGQ